MTAKTPTVLKLVKGNPGKRAIPKNEPKPRETGPSPLCPAHLDESGRVVWLVLSEMLHRTGVLTEADCLALERLCDCYTDIIEARKILAVEGRTFNVVDALGNILVKGHPAVGQLRAADAQFKSYLIEFGLTPAARTKVQVVNGDKKDSDPMQEFFG